MGKNNITQYDMKDYLYQHNQTIAELYLDPHAPEIGLLEFLNLLISVPRTPEEFSDLLKNIAAQPSAFYELVQCQDSHS